MPVLYLIVIVSGLVLIRACGILYSSARDGSLTRLITFIYIFFFCPVLLLLLFLGVLDTDASLVAVRRGSPNTDLSLILETLLLLCVLLLFFFHSFPVAVGNKLVKKQWKWHYFPPKSSMIDYRIKMSGKSKTLINQDGQLAKAPLNLYDRKPVIDERPAIKNTKYISLLNNQSLVRMPRHVRRRTRHCSVDCFVTHEESYTRNR